MQILQSFKASFRAAIFPCRFTPISTFIGTFPLDIAMTAARAISLFTAKSKGPRGARHEICMN